MLELDRKQTVSRRRVCPNIQLFDAIVRLLCLLFSGETPLRSVQFQQSFALFARCKIRISDTG